MFATLTILAAILWSTCADATITQGDFSIFGTLGTAWGGRWGEGSDVGGKQSPTDGTPPPNTTVLAPGKAGRKTGGSFDFNHWDLVSARQTVDLRTDDHIVKNYKLLGRIDTLFLHDADFYADYVGFYDAFPDLKHEGRAETARDWTNFTSADRINEFTRNEFWEYYFQLNFTDNFSMRVGKQQIIWSEADALSGTEVTNPTDFRFGNIVASSNAENSRVNLRMVKFDYILPDFLKTANNEFEFIWIPGDFEGAVKAQTADARNPWIPPVPIGVTLYNQAGQPFPERTLMDQGAKPTFPFVFAGNQEFADLNVITSQNPMSSSIDNSEFGARLSTLLPIGNGLQTSAIFLYEARSNKLETCQNCPAPPGALAVAPGIFFLLNQFDFGRPRISNNLGTIQLLLRNEYVRQPYLGLTGTYYDKDLTDNVFRYDFFWAPKVVAGSAGSGFGGTFTGSPVGGLPKWGEQARFIIATDRPTYIPWISKQHTFLVAQYTATYNPDPRGAQSLANFFFLAAVDWIMDGRLTTTNVWAWDPDDTVGFVSSSNVFRYSSHILCNFDVTWFLGRSGLRTGLAGILSAAQRTNEAAIAFVYEL